MRGWLPALAAAAMLLAMPRTAAAHAHLRWSSPAAGSTVGADVRQVRLRFSEGVEPSFTTVTLTGPDGRALAAGPLSYPAGGGGKEAVLDLAAPLAPGTWTVAWKAAATDGHTSHGTFTFTVRAAAAAAPATAPTAAGAVVAAPHDSAGSRATQPDATAVAPGAESPAEHAAHGSETMREGTPGEAVVRWIGFLALILMVGAVAFHFGVASPLLATTQPVATGADRRAAAAGLAAAVVSIAPLLLRLGSESAAVGGGDAWGAQQVHALLMRTVWGHGWMLQALATVAFAVGVGLARRGGGAGWTVAGAAALALGVVPALSGHAAASDYAGLAIVCDWLHVLGAAAWLGTLACLLLAGLPAAFSEAPDAAPAVAALVNRFSPVALAGAGVAGATGVASAWMRLDSIPQLWTTAYGKTLLVKLALLAVVAALGLYNWRSVRPRLGTGDATRRLRTTVRAEVAVGILVVLATAALVATPTP